MAARHFRSGVVALALAGAATLVAQNDPPQKRAREIFEQLIDINTTDSAGDVTAAALAAATRLKAAGFPAADVQVIGPAPRKGNLVARYLGAGARKPLLLLAHLDVVEAKRNDWSVDPFTFLERDGFFYGRGTSDDKAMASIFLANFIRLRQEGFRPDRDVVLALTADEEGGESNGVEWLLKTHRELIDAEIAINEGGSGQMKGERYLVNEVQASEKVYQDVKLESRNAGGHSSRPAKDNAIYHLAAALSRLAAYDFPISLNDVTRAYFNRMSTLQADPGTSADMRAAARLPPDRHAAARLAASSSYYNALMRTTCVATRLEGGHANNALPQTATAVVNCRILPGDDPAAVLQKLIEVIADANVSVDAMDQARPSPPSRLDPAVMQSIEATSRAMWPGAAIVPVMSTGATDGLYLRNAGIPTYGVEGLFYDLNDDRAHGRDERVAVKSFFDALEFHYRLIKALAAHDTPSRQ